MAASRLNSGVDVYAIWFDLAPGAKDLDVARAIDGWLGLLRSQNAIEGWSLERRKLGFGPDGLGEFNCRIYTRDLAQLDAAFRIAATRSDPAEGHHREVFSRVVNFRAGLYRSFPDPERIP